MQLLLTGGGREDCQDLDVEHDDPLHSGQPCWQLLDLRGDVEPHV
jgi:hypothetical protein